MIYMKGVVYWMLTIKTSVVDAIVVMWIIMESIMKNKFLHPHISRDDAPELGWSVCWDAPRSVLRCLESRDTLCVEMPRSWDVLCVEMPWS